MDVDPPGPVSYLQSLARPGHKHGKGATSDIECYKCGKKGHYGKDCWAKPKEVAELSEEQKNVEAIEVENDDGLMALDAEKREDLCEVCAVTNYEHDDTQAEILIDSGSEVTVCPKRFADQLGTNQADARLKLRAVDGTSVDHHGERSVPFEWRHRRACRRHR